jgi:hypothetical protein
MLIGWAAAALFLAAPSVHAVTVTIDFDEYGGSFFNPGTMQGSQARATLNAAANFYSNILNDTLAPIVAPKFTGSAGTLTWSWDMVMNHPSAPGTATLSDQTIAADEFRIYAGAYNHPGTTAAVGGPGAASYGRSGPPINSFTSAEINQINAIQDAFIDAVTDRGETSGFGEWGGTISLDTDTNWHFNHTTPPAAGEIDLYSVAIHEFAHALGFGLDATWTELVSDSHFIGAASMASYGSPVPVAGGHWQTGVTSTVYGGTASQVAIMTPNIVTGSRRQLTALDAAALTDIGWSVIPPPSLPGDYNRNGVVDTADFVLWRKTIGQSVASGSGADGSGNGSIGQEDFAYWRARFGNSAAAGGGASADGWTGAVPEPGSVALVAVACAVALCARRQRRG